MTFAMEFHDSRILEFARSQDGTGHALFHACVYRSPGIVLQDAQESGWQNVRFRFEGLTLDDEITLCEYASDGDLYLDGKSQNGTTFLPLKHMGDVRLEIRLSPNFEKTTILATGVAASLEGVFELEAAWTADGERLQTSIAKPEQ